LSETHPGQSQPLLNHGSVLSPFLAFHATPFQSNVEKIIEMGVLAPGDQIATTGEFLPMAHGARYGPGVYLTPDISLTSCYGYSDVKARRQALCCLVIPGRAHQLDPDAEVYSYELWKEKVEAVLGGRTLTQLRAQAVDLLGMEPGVLAEAERCESARLRRLKAPPSSGETKDVVVRLMIARCCVAVGGAAAPGTATRCENWQEQQACARKLGIPFFVDLERAPEVTAGDIAASFFPDGSQARLSPDRRQIVVASSAQVLPLLLVTYEPVGGAWRRTPAVLWSDPRAGAGDSVPPPQLMPPLLFHRIPPAAGLSAGPKSAATEAVAATEQWWSASIDDPLAKAEPSTVTRLILVLEAGGGSGCSAEIEAANLCAAMDLMRQIQPAETAAVVYGAAGSNVGHFGRLTTPEVLQSVAKGPAWADTSPCGLLQAACKGSELALRRHRAWEEEQKMTAAAAAYRELHVAAMPAWGAGQSAEAFARAVLAACVEKAASIGESSHKHQWIDYSEARKAQSDSSQPSINWGTKVSLTQKAESKLTARRARELTKRQEELFVVVYVTSSRHSDKAQSDEAKRALARHGQYLRSTGVRAVTKFLSVGATLSLPLAQRLTHEMQTVAHHEQRVAYQALSARELPSAARELCKDLEAVTVRRVVTVSVGGADRRLGCGWLRDLTRPPQWQVELVQSPDSGRSAGVDTLLWQGELPRVVHVAGHELRAIDASQAGVKIKGKTKFKDEAAAKALREEAEVHKRQLQLAQSLSLQLRVAALVGTPIEAAVHSLRALVRSVRAAMLSSSSGSALRSVADLAGRPPTERAALVSARRRLLGDVEQVMNAIEDSLRIGQAKAESGPEDEWVANLDSMRFGARALRRVGDDMEELSVTDLVDDLVHRLKPPGRDPARAAARGDLGGADPLSKEEEVSAEGFCRWESGLRSVAERPIDLLSAFGMEGLLVRVVRLDAAAVAPWMLVVQLVSTKRQTSDVTFAALESGLQQFVASDSVIGVSRAQSDDDKTANTEASSSVVVDDCVVVADPSASAYDREAALSFLRSKLHSLYLSTVFTRTPSLPLPAQRLALLSITWVRAVEQLLRGRMDEPSKFIGSSATRLHIKHTLQLQWTIRHQLRGRGGGMLDWVRELVGHMLQSDDPGAHMTEAPPENVASVVQVLICCCCVDASRPLFAKGNEAQLSRVALALMGEAVARGTRILVKQHERNRRRGGSKASISGSSTTGGGCGGRLQRLCSATSTGEKPYRPLLREALGISRRSCVVPQQDDRPELLPAPDHADHYSMQHGRAASWRFFRRSLTNCTPWAVVACLGWSSVVWQWVRTYGAAGEDDEAATFDSLLQNEERMTDLVTQLKQAFGDKPLRVSMNRFARDHFPRGVDPMLVQVALYAQGLRHHSSQSRRNGLLSLAEPDAILRSLAQEERANVYSDRLAAKHRRLAEMASEASRGQKREKLRARAILMDATHGLPHMPKLFSPHEVDQLNMERPPTDQLELMQSGLLRHHCCFPMCPLYLHSFATEKDRQVGSRGGLFRHLAHFQMPDRRYWPGMHLVAVSTFKAGGGNSGWQDKADFVAKFRAKIPMNGPTGSGARWAADASQFLTRWAECFFDEQQHE
jgi:hypothetical protein